MISDNQHLEELLLTAKNSVEACVVVGGTLLWTCYDQLKSCVTKGVTTKFLFPDPYSSWLIPIISATSLPINAYQDRITRNAQRTQELGPNVEIRWHGNPVTKWFVIIDRLAVVSKPFDVTTQTSPNLESRPNVIRYYTRLFDSIWASATNEYTWLSRTGSTFANQFANLRVFLCHSSEDKAAVRELCTRLVKLDIDVWLDERKLIAGQAWEQEINHALREAHVVIVCLSHRSVMRKGYMQKELRNALEIAQEHPDGAVFIIPARLDDCAIPNGLRHLQWVNIYENDGYERLLESLTFRARDLANLKDDFK